MSNCTLRLKASNRKMVRLLTKVLKSKFDGRIKLGKLHCLSTSTYTEFKREVQLVGVSANPDQLEWFDGSYFAPLPKVGKWQVAVALEAKEPEGLAGGVEALGGLVSFRSLCQSTRTGYTCFVRCYGKDDAEPVEEHPTLVFDESETLLLLHEPPCGWSG